MASSIWRVTPQSLTMTREDFERDEIYESANPHPEYGFAHGPIFDPNPGWFPQVVEDRLAKTGRLGNIKWAEIRDSLETNPPKRPMVSLNKINGLICDIAVARDGTMCGWTFNTQTELRKHLRNKHTGATQIITCRAQTHEQNESGRNALKRWVLSGGWRYAKYQHEPGHGSENSLIRRYCDALERLAREDHEFARKFGTQFHRPPSAPQEVLFAEVATPTPAPVETMLFDDDTPAPTQEYVDEIPAPSGLEDGSFSSSNQVDWDYDWGAATLDVMLPNFNAMLE